jgi:biopolymer transport protein ExbD
MRNKVTPEFTMAAMTDFVFQLLIIFMLISTLATETNSHTMDINLPTASISTNTVSSVTISVTPDLKYSVNGEEVPKEQIVDKLKQIMPVTNPPTVQLAIDEMAPHKVFVELVDMISVKNGWKIGVQTKEPSK